MTLKCFTVRTWLRLICYTTTLQVFAGPDFPQN
jgi:hypothetical protein